jgi:hypothetical protein
MFRIPTIGCWIALLLFGSCKNGVTSPDVSGVQVNLRVQRFEADFFSVRDSVNATRLADLNRKYPGFFPRYINDILGFAGAPPDSAVKYAGLFAAQYRAYKDSADKLFADFTPYEQEIRKGLQYVKHYFPQYPLPVKLITYVGPFDGFGDFIDPADSSLGIGLHLHLGKDFSAYKTTLVQEVYPAYISARFEPGYIAVNCMQNIVNDLYPERESDKPLAEQMIEKGKRLYLLSLLLPSTAEHKLIGYTEVQLKDCYRHEALIWNFFVKNNYLQLTDKNTIKNYLGEGPRTRELGEDAPGNIGAFCGWQMVKKYMAEHRDVSADQLMQTDNEQIFQSVRYKP